MRMRTALQLMSMCLLGACAVNPSHGESTDESSEAERGYGDHEAGIRHVLLVSVDGLHAADVDTYVAAHPESTFASLTEHGVTYAEARTPTPSDSFPGLLALVTGGTPRSTGVYYDDSYDRTLYAPGSACAGKPGTECTYFEIIASDASQLFSPINPSFLPLAKDALGHCKPVYPHDFIKVNTIFEVIRRAGGYTAWSDKHAAYDLVNGPSGRGVDDLYTPEINSLIKNGGTVNGVALSASLAQCDGTTNSLPLAKVGDYTTCEPAVMAYDDVKVQAVINEIDGKSSDGAKRAPVPTVLGMNFQEVSVAQKLPVGGYADAAGTPGPLLASALAHVDASLGRIVAELHREHLYRSTLVVLTSKHGQSPVDRSALRMEAGGRGTANVIDPLTFVNAADPNVGNVTAPFVNPNDGSSPVTAGHLMADDVGILWLQDQSRANVSAVLAQLVDPAHRAAFAADTLPPGTIFASSVTSGAALASIYGDPTSSDPIAAARAPNAFIQPNAGVIYSGSSKKIAEHGGGTLDDTHVALIVSNPRFHARTVHRLVSTTQVAPTILEALDLSPWALDAVRKEGTRALPDLDRE